LLKIALTCYQKDPASFPQNELFLPNTTIPEFLTFKIPALLAPATMQSGQSENQAYIVY